jgi:hypothetical protein
MKLTFKMIKTLLLGCTLNAFGQSCALAGDLNHDRVGGAPEITEPNLKLEQQSVSQTHSICIFEIDPLDKEVCSHFNFQQDQGAILALSATNKQQNQFWEQKYKLENASRHHYQWQENPDLSARALYVHNTHMRTILGYFVNITLGQVTDLDRRRFATLCHQFEQTPLFNKTSLPVEYVKLLRQYAPFVKGGALEKSCITSTNGLIEPTVIMTDKFYMLFQPSNFTSQNKLVLQNEFVLYIHFHQHVQKTKIGLEIADRYSPNFENGHIGREIATAERGITQCEWLDSSLMSVLNPKLIELKSLQGLNDHSIFGDTWSKILELEPAPTIRQYDFAARRQKDLCHYAKAGEIFNQKLIAIRKSGQIPTTNDYQNTIDAYDTVGLTTRDNDDKVKHFLKAAKYTKEKIKDHNHKKAETIESYRLLIIYFMRAGEDEKNDYDKAHYYAEAATHGKERFKLLEDAGQSRKAYDYSFMGYIHFSAGQYAKDVTNQTAYFSEAKQYYERALEVDLSEEFQLEMHEEIKRIEAWSDNALKDKG